MPESGLLSQQLYTTPEQQLQSARVAQESWAAFPLRDRLLVFRRFRHLLASEAVDVAGHISPQLPRSKADTLTAEILPLTEAIAFLEREAPRLLKPVRESNRSRPLWLSGLSLHVQRDPWGVVLVIAPSNYPLFLPGVQTLQALAAGNAVFWKPGVGSLEIALSMQRLLVRAGLPDGLVNVTGEDPEVAQALMRAGVDKVVMTGSESSGRAVLRTAADCLIPATVELSGCDAMFVLSDADLGRSTDALLFGLRLNGSSTCIAPRRIFLDRQIADSFERELLSKLGSVPSIPVNARTSSLVRSLVSDAVSKGATLLTPALISGNNGEPALTPIVLNHTNPQMQVMRTDVFAPIVSLCVFADEAEALALAVDCPFALGATVFGSTSAATAFAKRVSAGIVVVNDMIAPTADPRLSFGGRRSSGFGKSRGAEGLLEMTVSKTIAVQTAKRLRHLEPSHPQALQIFSGFLALVHGRGLRYRMRSLLALGNTLAKKSESQI